MEDLEFSKRLMMMIEVRWSSYKYTRQFQYLREDPV